MDNSLFFHWRGSGQKGRVFGTFLTKWATSEQACQHRLATGKAATGEVMVEQAKCQTF
jgi:hypothetical protein